MCDCVCLYVCTLASSVMLFVFRAMTHAMERAKRQTRHKLETTCWAGEEGKGKWLFLTSTSSLIHYRLYMSKRLPSVGFCGRSA